MSGIVQKVNVSISAAALVGGVNSKATNNHTSICELVYFAPTTHPTEISIQCSKMFLNKHIYTFFVLKLEIENHNFFNGLVY